MQDPTRSHVGPSPVWPDPCNGRPSTDEARQSSEEQPLSPTLSTTEAAVPRKRRLKPEVAARMAAMKTAERLQELYQRPVDDLSPEEIAQMRAAFFRG